MKVLIACEFSGTVRDAFTRHGHDATSCDLLPSETAGQHYRGDVRDILGDGWDLMIAHPPCTHLAVSGAAWFKRPEKQRGQEESLRFVLTLLNAPIPQIAVENPVGVISSRICPPSQIVEPYWFGDEEKKPTCLWLIGLPKLRATTVVDPVMIVYENGKSYPRWHDHYEGNKSREQRGYERSRTFLGFAEAMAEQWGSAQDYCWRSRMGYRRPKGFVLKPKEGGKP